MSQVKYGWHPITADDIDLGIMVRFIGMEDTFNTGVIISILDDIVIARPYVYANAEYSSNQPMTGHELVCYMQHSLTIGQKLEVWHGRDGVRKMVVKAA